MTRFSNIFKACLVFVVAIASALMMLVGLGYFYSVGQSTDIQDLKMPQDAMPYAKEMPSFQNKRILKKLKDDYLVRFWAPFTGMKPFADTKEVFWVAGGLTQNLGYDENLLPRSKAKASQILEQMQIDRYPTLNQKAMIIKDTNVRVVPSISPRFATAGGYPLDRWQNSLIFYGTPVLITHYDTSGRFVHIQTELVSGWVEITDVALVSEKQSKRLMRVKDFVMPNSDGEVLKDSRGRYITPMRVGKLFMIDGGKMLVFYRSASGKLFIRKEKIDLSGFHTFPQKFSQTATAGYINALMGQRYGWGGLYESRDCSSFIRDIFGNFGIYLPRNSASQARLGNHQIKFLPNIEADEKKQIIIKDAIPFSTLLWHKGHIMLYIGTNEDGEPIVAHSAWEVQSSDIFSKRYHRFGGVVITTLKPANEGNGYFFSSPTLLDRTSVLNFLYPYLSGNDSLNKTKDEKEMDIQTLRKILKKKND